MSDRAAIEQLARIVGTEAHYTDTFGHSYKVSAETLLPLVATFGQPELTEFASAHYDRVEFFQYLQWEAARQIAAAAAAGREDGFRWDSTATSLSAWTPTPPRHGRTRSSSHPEHRSARPLTRPTGQGRIGAWHRSTR